MNTYDLIFEWDSVKERTNIAKHGIDFRLASHVFLDPRRIEKYDKEHSDEEDRYITIGFVHEKLCVLTVIYVDRENTLRIISARYANGKEIEEYNEHGLL